MRSEIVRNANADLCRARQISDISDLAPTYIYEKANNRTGTPTRRHTFAYDPASNEQRIETPVGDLTTYTWNAAQMRVAKAVHRLVMTRLFAGL